MENKSKGKWKLKEWMKINKSTTFIFDTKAISKQNSIIRVLMKEGSKVLRHSNKVQLIKMSGQIENMSCS